MKHLYSILLIVIIVFSCKSKDEPNEIDQLLKAEPYANLTDSIKQFPRMDSLYIVRGNLLANNKQFALAKNDFEKAWKLSPTEMAGVLYGSSMIELNQIEPAIKHFNNLAISFPDNLKIHERLGFCYEQLGKYNDAIKEYDYILSKDNNDFVTLTTKGYALQAMNNDAEAIKCFEQSYKILPNKLAGNELAAMYAESKNPKTIAFCDDLIKNDTSETKSVEPIYLKGRYYKNVGNYNLALQFFDQSIKEDYTYPYAYLDKAEILYDQKKYNESIKILNIAKQNDNQNSEVYFRMGKCYEAIGNKDGAILEYQRAIALDKNYEEAIDALNKISP